MPIPIPDDVWELLQAPSYVHLSTLRADGSPCNWVSIRIIRPARAVGVLPVVFHFHGGGWILGDKDTNERLDRELANAAQAVVVFVDYTPAPDAQYPVQNEQAYTALQGAIANAAGIGAAPARVALAGDGAGGNMTAALTFMAKERGGPADRRAGPVLPGHRRQPGHRHLPALRRRTLGHPRGDALVLGLLPDRARRAEITASPLQASVDQLRGLPRP